MDPHSSAGPARAAYVMAYSLEDRELRTVSHKWDLPDWVRKEDDSGIAGWLTCATLTGVEVNDSRATALVPTFGARPRWYATRSLASYSRILARERCRVGDGVQEKKEWVDSGISRGEREQPVSGLRSRQLARV